MTRCWFAICLAILTLAGPAAANDSVAETAAGGLILTRSGEIDMVSEDLSVSADEVRVRYVFRNRTARAVRATVAFPMPDDDLSLLQESDVAFPRDFETKVDGKPVAMRVERKAILGGVDHSALLNRLHVPIADDPDPSQAVIPEGLNALPPADQARLVRLGLAAVEGPEPETGVRRHLTPLWTIRQTYYWDQVFPAGRDLIVEHRYKPGTGESVGTALTMADFRTSAEGRRTIADYCIDSAFLAGVDRMARQNGENAMIGEQRVGYVLKTGANWRAPIRDFRLVVDKGAAENLISFCGTGVRKVGPTRFEVRQANWRPDRDLKLLILFPRRAEE
jgi:hypothetical protein